VLPRGVRRDGIRMTNSIHILSILPILGIQIQNSTSFGEIQSRIFGYRYFTQAHRRTDALPAFETFT
jgi:hypothetical protein